MLFLYGILWNVQTLFPVRTKRDLYFFQSFCTPKPQINPNAIPAITSDG